MYLLGKTKKRNGSKSNGDQKWVIMKYVLLRSESPVENFGFQIFLSIVILL